MKTLFTVLLIPGILASYPTHLVNTAGETSRVSSHQLKNDKLDVLWDVLPPKTLSDLFGKRVSHEFYGIEVIIGNDTGSDLLVNALLFRKSDPQTVVAASLSNVMALTAEGKRARLCEVGFDGDLVVRTNTQKRTLVFIPRRLLGPTNNRGEFDSAQIRKQLGEPHVVGRKIVAEKYVAPGND